MPVATYGYRPQKLAWNGSWNVVSDNPSAVGAVSAMTCAIGAASALGARGRTSCKRQASGSNPLTGSQVNGVNNLSALGRVDRFVDRTTLVRAILLLCRESPKVA